MAVKTRAQLKSENAADFPNNTTGLISPADLRGQMDDIVDSAVFSEEIATLETAEPDTFSNIAIGFDPAIPSNRLLVRHDEVGAVHSDINVTASFQQLIRDPARTTQPTCIRGYQQINSGVGVASSFAISGELDSHTNEGGGLGLTATSGVAQKFGTAPVFAMHGVAIDNTNTTSDPTAVTSIIGAEFGTRAAGLDHPTSNLGYGSRRTMQLVPRSNPPPIGPSTEPGETGVGLDIRNSATGGYYRFALVIRELAGNPQKINTALEIDTSGTNGIVIKGGQTVPINVTGTGYFVNGTKVLAAQGAAVANATDAASVITQLNALLSRLRAHGIIAT